MIYNVYRTTANSVKGWFPFGLPIPARVVTVLEMSAYREMDAQVEQHLVSLNNRARGLNLSTGTSDELHAASLLFNVYRYLLGVWSGEGISADTRLNELRERVGEADFSDAKYRFCRVYPPAPDKETPTRFVVETILLRMCKSNPALALFRNLLIEPLPADASDAPATFAGPSVSNFESVIEEDVYYQRIMEVVSEAPDDLKAQLRHTVSRWGHALPAAFVDPILRAIDVLNEVHTFRGAPGEFVHSEPLVYDYQRSGLTEITAERFTPDRDWMSNVVLIAKQTYVWLFQLSEQYGREIRRLDDIPDEELDRLAGLGFTGLWLIGLWRRSQASETIKRRMGNPEAIASAYALDDYEIAQELGGVPAYEVLAEKANKRGIRLAADMVPNHVGIDGQWVKHHPERFISTHQLPYENYRFEGPDLCEDPHLSIYLEDGYYSQTDAAVVFKRVDHSSGDVRYIYHGNDGTQMPWNDTAQLDYLNADVREQVIQMILSVARRFP
ncbi:MAG: alpha-amylase family glycosyl hydrolase, partial [Bradymonadia bacterium]